MTDLDRRVRIVRVPRRDILDAVCFLHRGVVGVHQIATPLGDLPADAVILSVHENHERATLDFLVRHPSFPVVLPGTLIPSERVLFTPTGKTEARVVTVETPEQHRDRQEKAHPMQVIRHPDATPEVHSPGVAAVREMMLKHMADRTTAATEPIRYCGPEPTDEAKEAIRQYVEQKAGTQRVKSVVFRDGHFTAKTKVEAGDFVEVVAPRTPCKVATGSDDCPAYPCGVAGCPVPGHDPARDELVAKLKAQGFPNHLIEMMTEKGEIPAPTIVEQKG